MTSRRDLGKFVKSISIGAITYQAYILQNELDLIKDEEYPSSACQIRDVFRAIVHYILDELIQIDDPAETGKIPRATNTLRVRRLANVLQELYSYLRYLKASGPLQTSPAIQYAFGQLATSVFPNDNGTPICLIRPQWKYNLSCVPLAWELREIIVTDVLDPYDKLGADTPDELIEKIWQRYVKDPLDQQSPQPEYPLPRQLATLSFAGLDTNDALLYPLLAHELGHFIDFSYNPPYYLSPTIVNLSTVPFVSVEQILKRKNPHVTKNTLDSKNEALNIRASSCVREILADLLAVRIAGLGYFMALSEYLKTLAKPAWLPMVTKQGYPGTRFRLKTVLHYLLSEDFIGNPLTFLAANKSAYNRDIISYLDLWRRRLQPSKIKVLTPNIAKPDSEDPELVELSEEAVARSLPELIRAAKKIVPDDKCATLSKDFFQRIELLRHDLPPALPSERPNSFPEILSAAWTYQITNGEEKERKLKSAEDKHSEYQKTCRLVFKAIELVPTDTGTDPQNPSRAPRPKVQSRTVPLNRGVLDMDHLRTRIAMKMTNPHFLGVVPFADNNLQQASFEVHLGNWFVTARRMKIGSVQPWKDAQLMKTIGREEVFVQPGETFTIHPGDLVLGVTREFFSFPSDLMAFVEGKSSLGRLGLIVATATQVAPGFHGVIVLELANAGTIPLQLVPGKPIAQLVFQTMSNPLPKLSGYSGQYYCQIKP